MDEGRHFLICLGSLGILPVKVGDLLRQDGSIPARECRRSQGWERTHDVLKEQIFKASFFNATGPAVEIVGSRITGMGYTERIAYCHDRLIL